MSQLARWTFKRKINEQVAMCPFYQKSKIIIRFALAIAVAYFFEVKRKKDITESAT
jgi:hypothetical protein